MEKLKRLPHKYAHNRRYFELKSRLWNMISPYADEQKVYNVIDAAELFPDHLKALINKLPVNQYVKDTGHKYIDLLVELKGIVE